MSESAVRRVVVGDDYLDGIMALTVTTPGVWDATVREVPVAILDAYEDAWTRLRAAEQALREAWSKAADIPNPDYEAPTDAD